MSQIQNSCISKQALLPPVFFMGAALLAGKYAIQYFPGASKNGLLVAAGLASTTSYLYDCALYDVDHSYLRTLLGKATAIAFATLCINLAAKSLEGRANISWEAATQFAAVELAIAAVISYATGESALQKEHRHYAEYPYSWFALNKEKRTEKAVAFMKAGLPALMIEGDSVEKDKFPNPKSEEEWEALTPSELSWTVELRGTQDEKQRVFLYELMHKKGVDAQFFEFDADLIEAFKGKQETRDLLYQDMVRDPQWFYFHEEHIQEQLMRDLFNGKEPIPPVDVKLSPSQIKRMDIVFAYHWGKVIIDNDQWKDVSLETRSVFVRRLWVANLEKIYEGVDISWISEFVEEIRKFDNQNTTKIHRVMIVNQEAVKKHLSPEQLEAFNECFEAKGKEKIQ